MLADIHGVDPTQFKANLGERAHHDDGSRKKRRKLSEIDDRGSTDSDRGDDGLELHGDGSVEHYLDIQA